MGNPPRDGIDILHHRCVLAAGGIVGCLDLKVTVLEKRQQGIGHLRILGGQGQEGKFLSGHFFGVAGAGNHHELLGTDPEIFLEKLANQ